MATVRMEWLNPRTQDGRTDTANSRRLASLISGQAHYVRAWESWIVWDGKRWRQDDLAIRERAKEIPGTIIAAAMSPPPVDVNACNWAIKSASRASIEAMIFLAKSEPGIPVEHSELDADPWLLNCQNGTVDLRTGELRPHNQADKITRITSVAYDPDASTYEWDRFLEKILVDDGLIRHIQRIIGYCITGSTREQILPIFWGEGSNGKSTLLDTLKLALGVDYASTAPPSLIIQKKNEAHPTELAGLCGKRMVTAIETEKNQRLNEPLVKQLTGSDSISARRMRENFWEFRPTHKLILCTNHEPRVGDDFAIWRRLSMVPFTVQFWNPDKGETGPEELRRDNDLPNRLERSLEGVLAWAVRGAIDWFRDGLGTDQKSRKATEEYRKRQDSFGRFVEEVCVQGVHYSVRFSQLYDQYSDWCEENGERKLSSKSFGEWLAKKKFEKKRNDGIWICGITWKPEFDKTNSFDSFN
jgi:putative DNA primase/helicase